MSLSEVVDLLCKALIVDSIIEATSGESLSVSLQSMGLLDLTVIRKTYVIDTKIAFVIVLVR